MSQFFPLHVPIREHYNIISLHDKHMHEMQLVEKEMHGTQWHFYEYETAL